MPLYAITHATTYRYTQPVALSHQMLHLEPLNTAAQECLHFALKVSPRPLESVAGTDYFGNRVHDVVITERHRELRIEAHSKVTVTPVRPRNGSATCGQLRAWLENSTDSDAHQARQFLYDSPFTPRIPAVADFARRFFGDARPVSDALGELGATIHQKFVFDRTATTTATPLAEFFQRGRGICQDFAHLAVAALRAAGLPARYVSGYLLTEPPPGQSRLIGADASHAWVSALVPDVGWLDFDPTNDCLCDERHVTVARGRDYGDVSPVRGTMVGGADHTLHLAVTVNPVGE